MNSYGYLKKRALSRKLSLIEERGGKCEECGYEKNISALEFHHVEPKEKSFGLTMRELGSHSMKIIRKEFIKCKILCSNCHKEHHYPDLNKESLVSNFEIDKEDLEIKQKGKPNCLDCGKQINYTHKRCVVCERKNRRKMERPSIKILKEELKTNTFQWCADKYGVSRQSIYRWIGK